MSDPSTYSLTGYYSLRYGVGGVEAAFDDLLAGRRQVESLADYFNSQVLRLPQIGADIFLTVYGDIHEVLAISMTGLKGAAVVMDAKTGALLALHSQPSYDPNRLDEDWSALIAAEGDPFFNRALQGNYQLGGNINLLWLAHAIESGFELSLRFTDATLPVALDDATDVTCLAPPPLSELTLPEALIYGCPAPFMRYLETQSTTAYTELLPPFRFAEGTALPGFPAPETLPPPHTDAAADADVRARLNVMGQGDVTTTPLHLISIIAATANDGVAIEPWILAAVREPDEAAKPMQRQNGGNRRLMSASAAATLKDVLKDSWLTLSGAPGDSTAQAGAYIAMSRAGEETQLWLNGYVESAGENPMSFVILLEDSADIAKLLTIGDALIDALKEKA